MDAFIYSRNICHTFAGHLYQQKKSPDKKALLCTMLNGLPCKGFMVFRMFSKTCKTVPFRALQREKKLAKKCGKLIPFNRVVEAFHNGICQ